MTLNRRRFLKTLGLGTAAEILFSKIARGGSLDVLNAQQIPPHDLAHDPLRPEFHLLPQHNWMNDPNGPIWWKGKYHLFYQLNPHAAVWGDMHWGHAVSTDMIHWHHEPIALAPTPGGADSEGCFSGSAVVLGSVPTFIYTGVQNAPKDQVTLRDGNDKLRESQMVASAEDDRLLHWKKLETPVIPTPPDGMVVTGFRDPCPWREIDAWYLGVGSGERGKGGCVLLYRSKDLRQWEYLHKLAEGKPNGLVAANPCDSGEMWECPDFFSVNGQYCLFYSTEGKVIWTTGDYDRVDHLYTPRRNGVLDHGAFYAPKSFISHDGRRILWGWIQEMRPESEYAAAGWSGAMALPRVLTIGQQGQLEINPADEVETLRGSVEKVQVKSGTPYRKTLDTLRHEFHLPIGFGTGAVSVRILTGDNAVWDLSIDVTGNAIRCGKTSIPLPSLPWPRPSLRMFLDASVIESFIGGREAITSRVYALKPGESQIEFTVAGEKPIEISHWPLNPISSNRLTT